MVLMASKPAAVGITASGKITLPEVGSAHERRDEWIVILSGSTVVGQFAIQVRRLLMRALLGVFLTCSSLPAYVATKSPRPVRRQTPR